MNDLTQNTLDHLFDGGTFVADFDAARLTGQWLRVYSVMKDGKWRTLSEIQLATKPHYDSEAAISARLRDFRKIKWGGHTVNRRRRGDPRSGLFEYQVIVK
jgi:hypothetical protein